MRKTTLYTEDFNSNENNRCSFLAGGYDGYEGWCSLTLRDSPACTTCKITQVDYHEDEMGQGIFNPDSFSIRRMMERQTPWGLTIR